MSYFYFLFFYCVLIFLPFLHTVIFWKKPLVPAHAYGGRNCLQRPCRYSFSMKVFRILLLGVSLLHLFNRLSSHLCTWTHEYYFWLPSYNLILCCGSNCSAVASRSSFNWLWLLFDMFQHCEIFVFLAFNYCLALKDDAGLS